MRLISQALLVLTACLRALASRPSKDLILPHASLPEECFSMLPSPPLPGWTGDGYWEAGGIKFTDWQVMGDQIALDPSQLSQLSTLSNSMMVATMTFDVPSTCDGSKTLTVGLGDMAWDNLRLAPGSFKLTCGTPGVDHLTFQPAPVPGIVLQSLVLCPMGGPGQWQSEDLPEPSCHGHGCGIHHIVMAEAYYEETEGNCPDCHNHTSQNPSGAQGPWPPTTPRTRPPMITTAGPITAGAPATTTVAPTTTIAVTTEAAATTTEAPVTSTEAPATQAPATTTAATSCNLLPEDSPCNDGNSFTLNDRCNSNSCVGTPALFCNIPIGTSYIADCNGDQVYCDPPSDPTTLASVQASGHNGVGADIPQTLQPQCTIDADCPAGHFCDGYTKIEGSCYKIACPPSP